MIRAVAAILVEMAGLSIYALGYGFAYWAVFSNPFFATFVRIQPAAPLDRLLDAEVESL